MNITKLKRLAVFAGTLCTASGLMASDDALLDLLVEKGVLIESEAAEGASDLKKTPPVEKQAAEQPVFAKPVNDANDYFAKLIADFTDKRGLGEFGHKLRF